MSNEKNYKVKIYTFGCQMNKLDSDLAYEALYAAGYELVEDEQLADVILYNTCSVRDHAEERVVQRIRQITRPEVKVGILGCLAQRLGEGLFKLLPKKLDIVCGTRRFPFIDQLVDRALAGEERVIDVEETAEMAPGVLEAHQRSLHKGIQGYISIMRGCNNFCTYCIVPYVRGRESSRPQEAVLDEARALVDKGAVEITLLGQNVDTYGKDIGSDLAELLYRMHEEVNGVKRIRFVTSHPRDITPKLMDAVHSLPRVCNHLHMPAQSGSTRVLEKMRRGYSREIYDEKLQMISQHAPGVLVTSDFIVGFPTETEEDFQMTADLVRGANFLTSYVFKYSPRPGTHSAKHFVDDVADEDKKRRNQELLKIQEEVSLRRNTGLIGREFEVLAEGPSAKDKTRYIGRTSENLICVFPAPPSAQDLTGELVTVRVKHATPLTLICD